MVKDSDGSIEIQLTDEFQDFVVSVSLSDRQDLFAEAITVGLHTVEIDCQQMGSDLLEDRFESIELVMGMVEVVDDSDVGESDGLDESDLVFRFAVPTAVVVQSDLAIGVLGGQSDFSDPANLRFDEGFGLFFVHRQISAAGDPKLRMDLVFFDQAQDQFCFVV